MTNEQPRPFRIQVDDAVLDDLNQRLAATRVNEKAFNQAGKHYGQERDLQKELLRYWRSEYDWRKHESELNSFDNYLCKVQGLDVHFIHQKSKAPNAVPLLIVHGWPGSIWEFHRAIPKLVEPDAKGNAFHVIAPSIPGYAWSEAAKEPGMSVRKVAQMFDELMVKLGYTKYTAQGGDWGAIITKQVALQFPQRCVLLHQNMPIPNQRNLPLMLRGAMDMTPIGRFTLSAEDQNRLKSLFEYSRSGNAYLLLHSSKPHTLGDALEDSPAGLLSWIAEKCLLWADCRDGGLFSALSKDDILTNVMIYWVTNSITSSMRLYYETIPLGKRSPDSIPLIPDAYIGVPTGIGFFPQEAIAFPLPWLRHAFNVVHYTEHKKGGHFAAWEQPEAFAKDVRKFAFEAFPFKQACELADKGGASTSAGMSTYALMVAAAASLGLVLKSRM